MEGTINGFLQKGKWMLPDKRRKKPISQLKISESRKICDYSYKVSKCNCQECLVPKPPETQTTSQ